MSLHGDIRINGSLLGVWTARRTVKHVLDVNAAHPYECVVQWVDFDQCGVSPLSFRLDHRYSDGATALAAKVLDHAASAAPSAPGVRQ